MFIIGDLEADGLLSSATRIWCASYYVVEVDSWNIFTPELLPNYEIELVNYLYTMLKEDNYFVCHNALSYDVPLMEKITGISLPREQILDTLILSKMMFPDIKGHAKPHSLEAWGERFGIKKPEHEDWSKYSKEMLHRNIEDTKINTKLFKHIQKQGFKL